MTFNELEEKVYHTLFDSEKGICGVSDFSVFVEDGMIKAEVVIHWGDWKHDHLYCDHLMRELKFEQVDVDVFEEDGSDAYSAVRNYEYFGEEV